MPAADTVQRYAARIVALKPSFADYAPENHRWVTIVENPFYPDYLDLAIVTYKPVIERFGELLAVSESSADLLRRIGREPSHLRRQLQRVFNKYVSPDTSVEMLKATGKTEQIIANFGDRFRLLAHVRSRFAGRPANDEALSAVLAVQADRGRKGYALTQAFFQWFEARYGQTYDIVGPVGAGRDVMLDEVLPHFDVRIPADFLVSRNERPLVVGFAHYDSDRGGAQEDDRTGGYRDKIAELLRYGRETGVDIKVMLLNDGPGLLLGSMWRDYAALEALGAGRVLVATLKLLDERFTDDWLES